MLHTDRRWLQYCNKYESLTYLHRRTQATTDGLSGGLASQATVIQDGVSVVISATNLVLGDLAIVGASEIFPADGLFVADDVSEHFLLRVAAIAAPAESGDPPDNLLQESTTPMASGT